MEGEKQLSLSLPGSTISKEVDKSLTKTGECPRWVEYKIHIGIHHIKITFSEEIDWALCPLSWS